LSDELIEGVVSDVLELRHSSQIKQGIGMLLSQSKNIRCSKVLILLSVLAVLAFIRIRIHQP
jgi:hypothetical protein